MNKLVAGTLVFIGSACYGMLSTMTKLAYVDGFSTADIVGSQNLFALITFWLCCFPNWKKMFSLPAKTIVALVLSGCCTALTGIFYYLSLQTLSASFAVVLLFQFTWIGIMLDWVWNKNKPTKNKWIAVVFILAGTAIAASAGHGGPAQGISAIGVCLALLAALTYALFVSFSGNVATHVPTLMRNAWMVVGSLILTFSVFPPQFLMDGSLQRGLWFWGGFMAMFGAILPVYLFSKGVPRIGTGMATILGAVEFPVVIIFSSYLLKEQTSWLQWTGIMIIFLGILISVGKDLKKKSKALKASRIYGYITGVKKVS